MMYVFAKSMALFWTAAEVGILAAVRWGHLLSAGRDVRFRGSAVGAALLVTAAGAVLFLGEALAGRLANLERPLSLTLYRWALWNAFCTLWVVLEGCIMIYVGRLYRTLCRRGQPSGDAGPNRPYAGPLSLVLLSAGLFGLYAAYQAGLLHAAGRFGLDPRQVVRISTFYIRICGVFWILFEWVVAVQGIRAYRLLRRGHGG